MRKTKILFARVDPKFLEELEKAAKKERRSLSSFVREILYQFLKKAK